MCNIPITRLFLHWPYMGLPSIRLLGVCVCPRPIEGALPLRTCCGCICEGSQVCDLSWLRFLLMVRRVQSSILEFIFTEKNQVLFSYSLMSICDTKNLPCYLKAIWYILVKKSLASSWLSLPCWIVLRTSLHLWPLMYPGQYCHLEESWGTG